MLYDTIGRDYGTYRRPDPRIARAITDALGGAETVVNIGAGAGSYEPADRDVVAVEPAWTMIEQRSGGGARVVQASAIHLPFRASAFDAALAVLTVHHWPDRRSGLAEMARVARRVVIVTWIADVSRFWLVEEYFPEIVAFDRRLFPSLPEFAGIFGDVEVRTLPIPHDCRDGFLGAYWQRPEAYLDAGVRGAISTFAKLEDVGPGVARLERDLKDGSWARRHGDLLTRTELDLGYRLLIARRDGGAR